VVEEILTAQLKTITGLTSTVWALTAPEKPTAPFLIYKQQSGEEFEILNGFTGCNRSTYELNIMNTTYRTTKTLAALVIAKLKTMQGATYSGTLIQAVFFDENSPEIWEEEIKLYRKIINVTIIY
jgi:hypothetical protein